MRTGITRASVTVLLPTDSSRAIPIHAAGIVPTGGYTNPRIEPKVYGPEPADGIYEFLFTVTPPPPSKFVTEVETPISARYDFTQPPDWVKGVRVSVAP